MNFWQDNGMVRVKQQDPGRAPKQADALARQARELRDAALEQRTLARKRRENAPG